jgi:hypothetical protein
MAQAAEGSLIRSGIRPSNENPFQEDRLLALEIRPQKFGFVVFEGPTRLLDWGVRSYVGPRAHCRATLKKRIQTLLDSYAPVSVVMRWRNGSSRKQREAIRTAVQTIGIDARSGSIKLRSLNTRAIQQFFAMHGCATKHEIASLLGKRFEELSWKVPKRRKPWHCESYHTCMFDAAATGMTFFNGADH